MAHQTHISSCTCPYRPTARTIHPPETYEASSIITLYSRISTSKTVSL